MKCYMHVNYLERIFDLDEIARRAADAGYDGIECRGWDIDDTLPAGEYLTRPIRAAQAAGLDLVLASLNPTTSIDPDQRAHSLDELKYLIRVAADAGVKILNVFGGSMQAKGFPYHHFDQHGSSIASDHHFRITADYFRDAGETAAERGIRLCVETHNAYLHDLAEPTARLLAMIGLPNVLANLDWGNIFLHARNNGLEETLRTLRGRLGYAHLKNLISFREQGVPVYRGVPLSEGDINIYLQLRRMLADGFAGPLALENVMPGDKRFLVKQDLQYLKEILGSIAESAMERN